jgi:hypothetical protein
MDGNPGLTISRHFLVEKWRGAARVCADRLRVIALETDSDRRWSFRAAMA